MTSFFYSNFVAAHLDRSGLRHTSRLYLAMTRNQTLTTSATSFRVDRENHFLRQPKRVRTTLRYN